MHNAIVELVDHVGEVRKRLLVVVIENLENAHGLSFSLNYNKINIAHSVSAAQVASGGFTDKNTGGIGFAGTFQTACKVYAITNDSVIHALGTADVA